MDIWFAWAASIASGVEPLIIKASSKHLVTNPWLFNILWLTFLLPFTIPYALINGGGVPKDWWSLIGVGVCSAAFYALYTIALYKIDVSTMAPLFSLRTIFSILLGVLVLHETVSPLGWVLIAVIVLASPLAAYDEKLRFRALWNPSIGLAVIAMAALALLGYFVHVSYDSNGFASTLLWQDVLALLLLLPALIWPSTRLEGFSKRSLVPFILLGLAGLVYNASTILAYGHNLLISSVIVSLPLSMVFVWLASRKYSRFLEKHTTKVYVVRFSGALIMIGGALWLTVSR